MWKYQCLHCEGGGSDQIDTRFAAINRSDNHYSGKDQKTGAKDDFLEHEIASKEFQLYSVSLPGTYVESVKQVQEDCID